VGSQAVPSLPTPYSLLLTPCPPLPRLGPLRPAHLRHDPPQHQRRQARRPARRRPTTPAQHLPLRLPGHPSLRPIAPPLVVHHPQNELQAD
jgi:hypothetical protein